MPDRASSTSFCATPNPKQAARGLMTASGSLIPRSPSPLAPSEYWWVLPGTADQIRHARRLLAAVLGDCPCADDVILCLSELAANAVRHSISGHPGGTFAVHAEIRRGHSVVVQVRDQGGHWQHDVRPDERMHGLSIVAQLADELCIDGDPDAGWTASARFTWTR